MEVTQVKEDSVALPLFPLLPPHWKEMVLGRESKLKAFFSLWSSQELLERAGQETFSVVSKDVSFAKRQRNISKNYRSLLARNVGNVREY